MTATAERPPTGTTGAKKAAAKTGSMASDTLVVTKRNILQLFRQPQLILFSTVQPVILVLLFNFVFGGAIGQTIRAPGVAYIDYLLPGIMLQAVALGSNQTSVGMAEDLTKGIIDRFRALPMARSAVLGGRTMADAVRIGFTVLLMTAVGVGVGYRFTTGVLPALAAFVLAVGFGLAFSWIAAWVGMVVRNPEAAQPAAFVWLFPLSFASSAFVPIETFDPWLEAFARVNPITHFVDALRSLTLDVPTGTSVIPTGEPIWLALAWIAGILLVFAPLAVRQYKRTA
jgi:ABC transporter DrrB family efflux protein